MPISLLHESWARGILSVEFEQENAKPSNFGTVFDVDKVENDNAKYVSEQLTKNVWNQLFPDDIGVLTSLQISKHDSMEIAKNITLQNEHQIMQIIQEIEASSGMKSIVTEGQINEIKNRGWLEGAKNKVTQVGSILLSWLRDTVLRRVSEGVVYVIKFILSSFKSLLGWIGSVLKKGWNALKNAIGNLVKSLLVALTPQIVKLSGMFSYALSKVFTYEEFVDSIAKKIDKDPSFVRSNTEWLNWEKSHSQDVSEIVPFVPKTAGSIQLTTVGANIIKSQTQTLFVSYIINFAWTFLSPYFAWILGGVGVMGLCVGYIYFSRQRRLFNTVASVLQQLPEEESKILAKALKSGKVVLKKDGTFRLKEFSQIKTRTSKPLASNSPSANIHSTITIGMILVFLKFGVVDAIQNVAIEKIKADAMKAATNNTFMGFANNLIGKGGILGALNNVVGTLGSVATSTASGIENIATTGISQIGSTVKFGIGGLLIVVVVAGIIILKGRFKFSFMGVGITSSENTFLVENAHAVVQQLKSKTKITEINKQDIVEFIDNALANRV